MLKLGKPTTRFGEVVILSVRGIRLLTKSGKRTLLIYSLSLSVISILDALGLGLLASSLPKSGQTPLDSQKEFVYLLFLVVLLFISRSVLAVFISHMALQALAKEEVAIGQLASEQLVNRSWLDVRNISLSDVQLQVDRSSNSLVQNFLFVIATVVAEGINALLIIILLFVVSPYIAVITGIYFLLVSVGTHLILAKATSRAGASVANEFENVYRLLDEAFQFRKTVRVMESLSIQKSLRKSRELLAKSRASATFLTSVPRYLMESVLAFGCLLISGAAVINGGAESVVPALAIFAGAGFRLLPIVNKIQGQILVLLSSYPLAKSYFRFDQRSYSSDEVKIEHSGSLTTEVLLSLEKVTFTFPDSDKPTLLDLNLRIEEGKQYAIIGDSGSGKTTLTEVIMGLLPPTSGIRKISSTTPIRIGYLPQDIPLLFGSIEQNIALSWDSLAINDEAISDILKSTNLESFVEEFNSRTLADDNKKLMLSVGQRQRLGVARALYHRSNLLILDEPTSSLDAVAESQLVEVLRSLRPKVTVIIVSHRLTSIRTADEIIYLVNGRIESVGNFDYLSQTSPGFRELVNSSSLKQS